MDSQLYKIKQSGENNERKTQACDYIEQPDTRVTVNKAEVRGDLRKG
jgi:hypothetical protein